MDERTPPLALAAPLSIEDRLARVVEKHLGLAEGKATPTARFIEDLQADSLDVMEMLLGIEDTFGVTITDDEAAKLATVADASALVSGKFAAIARAAWA